MEGEKSQEKWQPKPAESFGIHYLNVKQGEIQTAMRQIDGFSLISSGSIDDETVYFEGENKDRTKIRIEIKKGIGYKSPKELAEIEKS